MPDTLVYVYAVGDRSLAHQGMSLVAPTGVGGEPVRTVVSGRLAAVVNSVDSTQFDEDALRRNLEDLRWLERTARAHHGVVDAVGSRHPIAPMRLATIYLNDENVRTLLDERAGQFATALDRITGRVELGVKAFAVRTPEEPEPEVDPAAGPGAAYLMRRRAARDRATEGGQRVRDVAEEVHRRLSALAVGSRRYPPQDPRLTGYHDEMVLNAAYLVEHDRAGDLTCAVEDVDAPGLRLETTGPWAPYSFAALDDS
jgi:gas vesicle protein GvpL/GvpF